MSMYDNFQSMVIAKRKAAPVPAPELASQAEREVAPPEVAEPPGTPVFLTPQSFVTFPGASLAVLILSKTIEVVFPSAHNIQAIPVLASLLIGGVIYWASLTPDMSRKDMVVGGCLAFLNSCYVALFVIGIPLTLSQMQQQGSSPSPAPAAEAPVNVQKADLAVSSPSPAPVPTMFPGKISAL